MLRGKKHNFWVGAEGFLEEVSGLGLVGAGIDLMGGSKVRAVRGQEPLFEALSSNTQKKATPGASTGPLSSGGRQMLIAMATVSRKERFRGVGGSTG